MNTNPELDDFLNANIDGSSSSSSLDYYDSLDLREEEKDNGELLDLVEHDNIDPRLKLLSHSSRLAMHKCPKAYQLYRLNSINSGVVDILQGITFSYGTAVGIGIQSILEGKTESQVILDVFLAWDVDLLDSNPKQKKSIWEAIFAAQRFFNVRLTHTLKDYELVYYKGKPAVELGFKIQLDNGYSYRGFLDAVLQHKVTKEALVLESKTSSIKPDSAQYKNSGQAIGYSIVLDTLFPELSSYKVLYMIYYTKAREYVEMPFTKTLLQRALWLQDLLLDVDKLKLYEEYNSYPMHGESCFNFFKPCEYIGLCTLSLDRLIKPITAHNWQKLEDNEAEAYDFTVDFYDLVTDQIKKGEL